MFDFRSLPSPRRARLRLVAGIVAAVTLGSLVLGSGCVAMAAMPAGQTIDGIRCDTAEGAVFHIHQHLTILDRGKPLAIPSDIGRPLATPCLYWLHTHSPDGLVHIEAPKFRSFTLGNFFDVWGEPLTKSRVSSVKVRRGDLRVYVNGSPYRGDARKIELSQHTDIAIEVGPPYTKPAPFTDWQGQ